MSQPNISILALTNGQLLISEVNVQIVGEPDGPQQEVVTLTNPCQVSQEVREDGLVNASFEPIAVLCAGNAIQISNMHVVWSAAPEDGFAKVYLQRFGHLAPDDAPQIITPPEKKLIVPGV
jgi:hypothetical protein